MSDPLDFLAQRLSVPARQLEAPGPDADTLHRLLEVAVRVPDHGTLTPWRLITLAGDAKMALSEDLADLFARKHPDKPEAKKEKERKRYTWAPLVIVAVARIDPESRIPEQEQWLSAGCVAYNLLLGAQALGFGAQWLTGWAAHDREAATLLGLDENEHVTGFIHVGTPRREISERQRPSLDTVVSAWKAP